MAELISQVLFVLSDIFGWYWIISFSILQIGFYFNVGIRTIEFFRIWLKPLFSFNFLWFLIIECIFSLAYWIPFFPNIMISILLKRGLFYHKLYAKCLFFISHHSFKNILKEKFFSWIGCSILIYFIVMIPYFILQHRLSYYFKKKIFKHLSPSLNAINPKYIGQLRGPVLSRKLFTQLASRNKKTHDWVKKSLNEFAKSPWNEEHRFSIDFTPTDHMYWELNNVKADFFEALINFLGEKKQIDSDGKKNYSVAMSVEMFDGIVICVNDIFESEWEPEVFETAHLFDVKKRKHREAHQQNFTIKLLNSLLSAFVASKDVIAQNTSILEEYKAPEKIKIKKESNIQYIVRDKKNLYLLVNTKLESTAFDLNMNIPVRKSMEFFRQDLALVHSALEEIQDILQSLEEFENKYRTSLS